MISILPIKLEGVSIFTVLQLVLCNPLPVSIPSLCRYTCYCCRPLNIHLQPLIIVIMQRWPATSLSPASFEVYPGLLGSMIWPPSWRGAYLRVKNSSALHSEGKWSTHCAKTNYYDPSVKNIIKLLKIKLFCGQVFLLLNYWRNLFIRVKVFTIQKLNLLWFYHVYTRFGFLTILSIWEMKNRDLRPGRVFQSLIKLTQC